MGQLRYKIVYAFAKGFALFDVRKFFVVGEQGKMENKIAPHGKIVADQGLEVAAEPFPLGGDHLLRDIKKANVPMPSGDEVVHDAHYAVFVVTADQGSLETIDGVIEYDDRNIQAFILSEQLFSRIFMHWEKPRSKPYLKCLTAKKFRIRFTRPSRWWKDRSRIFLCLTKDPWNELKFTGRMDGSSGPASEKNRLTKRIPSLPLPVCSVFSRNESLGIRQREGRRSIDLLPSLCLNSVV